jgi:ketosteroid isomerase-like protein
MSHANVVAFMRGSDAANRRDIEGLLAVLDPEVEWHPAMAALLGGEATVYRGHEGVRAWLHDQEESFAESRIDYSAIRALGKRVVAVGRLRTRGRESGADMESPVGWVVDFKDGKVIRAKAYLDPKEALEAAGLRDQATPPGQVELVRMLQDAWNRGDTISPADYFHPDVEFLPLRAATEGDYCRGAPADARRDRLPSGGRRRRVGRPRGLGVPPKGARPARANPTAG